MPDFVARQRRIYRAQSAALLENFDLTCNAAELASIDWPALESVPHWCFLTADDQRVLRLLCGAVFLAPQMHGWIEGRRIQAVRELIGPEAYDLVLRSTEPLADNLSIDEISGEVTSALEEAGYAVLFGAISHPIVQSLVARGAVGEPATLATSIATPLYLRALEIFFGLRPQIQAPDSSPVASAVAIDS